MLTCSVVAPYHRTVAEPFTSASELGVVIGIDLVRISDVNASLEQFGDRYAQRVFTSAEIGYCRQHPDRAGERFAARFAAKEAAMKVLRPSDADGVSWRSIEVTRTPEGWCDIVLHGAARGLADRRGIAGMTVSISHEHEYAI